MGYWCTLHLFDDQKFYREVVPVLKGEKGDLPSVCVDFARSYVTGGISRLNETETRKLGEHYAGQFIKISNSFDRTFKMHQEYAILSSYEQQRNFFDQLDGYYDFCRFFEYYLFRTCADFYPHIPLGKGGVGRNFTLDVKTLSYSAISALDDRNEFLSGDLMGITNWMTNEDLELLYLDKENLRHENDELAEGFLTLLEAAHRHKLGLVAGIDMRENHLELLPGYKLTGSAYWQNINRNGLLF